MKALIKLTVSGLMTLVLSLNLAAQKEKTFEFAPTVFNESELRELWTKFSTDADWQALTAETDKKGFVRILNKEASWGFRGTLTDSKGNKENVLFCAFDFVNAKDYKQGCSMIWQIVGERAYKAYVVFPPGETDIDKRFANAQEWYAQNGKVEKAHSWGTRFRACVQRGVPVPGVETELGSL
jgi:hypothetical protein